MIGARVVGVPALPPESIGRGVGSARADDEGDSEIVLLGIPDPLFGETELEFPGVVQPGDGVVAGAPAGGEYGLLMPGVVVFDAGGGVAILPGSDVEAGGLVYGLPPAEGGGTAVDAGAGGVAVPVDVGRGTVFGSAGPLNKYGCVAGTLGCVGTGVVVVAGGIGVVGIVTDGGEV